MVASDEVAGTEPIRVGISACLTGERVRFNGEHSRDPFLTDTVGRFVEFVPVCPEMEIGLGAPRETIRLETSSHAIRLVAPKSGTDLTDRMTAYARNKVAELEKQDLCGFVFKKDSPSCGLFRVKTYDAKGVPCRDGRGLFASVLTELAPQLPVEEEGRLNDPKLRENFFERVFGYRRLRDLFTQRWTIADLVAFQTHEKLLLQAHDPKRRRELGEMAAKAKDLKKPILARRYQQGFMRALARHATPGRHANVLEHMARYVSKVVAAGERAALARVIEDYRCQLAPLMVPITLIRQFVERHSIAYLAGQSYLEPHPKEQMLRNHC